MRTAVDLLMDIFRQVDVSEAIKIDIQRANQGNAAAQRQTSKQQELEGV